MISFRLDDYLGKEGALFSDIDLSRYDPNTRRDIENDAHYFGKLIMGALARGLGNYRVDEHLSKREGLDGLYTPNDEIVLDGAVDRDPGKRTEVYLHERMHRLLTPHDRNHTEDATNYLTEMILQTYLDHEDDTIRFLANAGYQAFQERFAQQKKVA